MYEHENKRDIHTRSFATRRAAGCGNEPSRCLNFCHARRVYETLNSNGAPLRPLPVRFVSLRCFTSRRSLFASFSCAYITEVAPL